MRMTRARFSVRGLMVAVAAAAIGLAVAAATARRPLRYRPPRDAREALEHVSRSIRLEGDYDVEIRRMRPGEDFEGQFGALFAVTYIERDGRGVELARQTFLVFEEGDYILHTAPRPRQLRAKAGL